MNRSERPKRLTVLLAEDDEDLRTMLAAVLRRAGHHVVELGDGPSLKAEIELGRSGRSGRGAHVIVTDVRLPRQGGLEVIRAVPADRTPPFIVITAYATERLRTEARALGALAVFAKPFDFDDLLQVLKEGLQDRWRG